MDSKSVFITEEKEYPMIIDADAFITKLGPFTYQARKHSINPKNIKEALSFFEYGNDPKVLPMRLPTEDEFKAWQRKSSTIFHPEIMMDRN